MSFVDRLGQAGWNGFGEGNWARIDPAKMGRNSDAALKARKEK
jgi:hypothetical protein